jgi:hypothetical protein
MNIQISLARIDLTQTQGLSTEPKCSAAVIPRSQLALLLIVERKQKDRLAAASPKSDQVF